MSFLSRIFGFTRSPATASLPQSQLASGHSQNSSSSPVASHGARRELLRLVLRDTLSRHGVPSAWISAELLVTSAHSREPGIHWRLVVKHWDPRLFTHAVAFQQNLIRRVMTFDPLASSWLTGISWQFALPDESVCPPMPPPVFWTAEPPSPSPAPAPAVAGRSLDVISGPVRIVDPVPPAAKDQPDATRADLEQLFAVRDADFKRHASGQPGGALGHEATQPMFLDTEPAKL